MRRICTLLVVVFLASAAFPAPFGGWMVMSMRELPEFLEVGKPTELSFVIRAHGRNPLKDLAPVVALEAAGGRGSSKLLWPDRSPLAGGVKAVPGPEAGLYRATITPKEPGTASIVIDTDYHSWKVRLLPLRVVAAGGKAPVLSPSERGRRLFVAKGCLTCHAKRDEPTFARWKPPIEGTAPDLTGLLFAEKPLAKMLADPAFFRVVASEGAVVMPKIALDEREIDALVSFLNRGKAAVGGK